MAKVDAYDIVTDAIVASLEAGTVPWHRPWSDATAPRSLASGRAYRGVNVLILALTAEAKGYTSPFWGTFNQIKARGGKVRKGERATSVVLWRWVERKDDLDDNGRPKRVPFLRYFSVFNAEQADDLQVPVLEERVHEPLDEAQDVIETFLANGGPSFKHGGDRAYYAATPDRVTVPRPESFESSEAYYSTVFHELGHSTGHEKRLHRTFGKRFGDGPYSREELVAEITACFLCSETGIEPRYAQSAAYIAGWLQALRDDNRLVVSAAGAAQRAADLILGVTNDYDSAAGEDPAAREAVPA